MTQQCALWYLSHGSIFVEMCDDEAEAIDSAISMQDAETGAVAGIQRADGSYTDRDHWAEYQVESSRRLHEFMDELRRQPERPRPAMREVTPPFETHFNQKARVPVDAPAWLGRQVSLAGEAPPGATGSADPGGAPS